jgi:hypothetical protein
MQKNIKKESKETEKNEIKDKLEIAKTLIAKCFDEKTIPRTYWPICSGN